MVELPKLASEKECLGCMLCVDTCIKQAITVNEDSNGYWMPSINESLCVGCRACERNCKAVREVSLLNKCKSPLKGWHREASVRKNCASGGAFSAVAQFMIRNYHAVIVGATLKNNRVYHMAIEKEEDIALLQGSKYIQSNTAGIYRKVKQLLKSGRFVVFSGTPCQVKALRVFLQGKNNKLLTIDLICHGVVSNTIFSRHIEKTACGEVINFRDKSLGWGRDVFFKAKKNGIMITDTNWRNNFFYHVFQLETCTRYNCYDCKFCRQERIADITIGDYWAARHSDEYNPMGISTILANTQHGLDVLRECDNMILEPADWYSTIKFNPRLFVNRPLFQKFSCSRHIGVLYKYLPKLLTDRILGVWFSKRNFLFLPWFKYIQNIKERYEIDYQEKLKEYFEKNDKQ